MTDDSGDPIDPRHEVDGDDVDRDGGDESNQLSRRQRTVAARRRRRRIVLGVLGAVVVVLVVGGLLGVRWYHDAEHADGLRGSRSS